MSAPGAPFLLQRSGSSCLSHVGRIPKGALSRPRCPPLASAVSRSLWETSSVSLPRSGFQGSRKCGFSVETISYFMDLWEHRREANLLRAPYFLSLRLEICGPLRTLICNRRSLHLLLEMPEGRPSAFGFLIFPF